MFGREQEIVIGNLVVSLTAILYLAAPLIVGDSVNPYTQLLLKWYPLLVILFAAFVNRRFIVAAIKKIGS